MFTRRLSTLGVFLILAAVGSGLLLAQSPQAVGTWVGVGTADNPFGNGAHINMGDGRTLIVGGTAPDGAATNVVASFDTATSQFTVAGTLLTARTGHTATLLKDGRVLVTGGTTNSLVSTDIEIFDPSTGASTLVAQMPEPRRGHVAALLQNGSVVIAGGYTTENAVLQSAFVFNPATNSISPTASGMNVARASASATSLIDGRVVIIGGTDGTNDLRSAEIYDPSLQSFTTTSTQLSVPLHGHAAVLLPHNGSVLIAGGTSNGTAQAGADLFLPAIFPDPFSWGVGQFAPAAAMNTARSSAIGGPTAAEGYSVVTGGGSNGVERYRFATIKTDKDDYPPGQTAIITGSGWQPNEDVTLLFQEDPAVHEDYVLTVTADGDGNIHHDTWAPEEHDANVRFYLMATGQQSGRRAQMTFTDSVDSVTITSVNPTTAITSLPATVTVNFNYVTSAGATSGVLDILGTSLSATKGLTSGSHSDSISVTIPAGTPNGSYNAKVTVSNNTSGGSNQKNDVENNSVVVNVPTNAAPSVTLNGANSTNEGTTEHYTFTTIDANATDTFSLESQSCGANGTLSNAAFNAANGAGSFDCTFPNGPTTSTVSVQVRDSANALSTPATITVTVANAAPVINGGANSVTVTLTEDGTPTAFSLTLNATDVPADTLTWSISSQGNLGTASASGDGTSKGIGYTPNANENGIDVFIVRVSDGLLSDTITVNVNIVPVNDGPTFTGGGNVSVSEDSGSYSNPWASNMSAGPANESGQTLTFITTNDNGGLFSVQPAIALNGTLTFMPAANAFGTALVTVSLSDDGGTANDGVDTSSKTFTITVNAVNDAPSFTGGGDVTVNEDSVPYSATWATVIGAGPNESGQTLTFNVSNNNNALFSVQPSIASNGTLTFTLTTDAFGTATVTVSLKDDGGTANGGVDTSASQQFTITVKSVNDAPSFTSGGDVTVNEDSGAYSAAWATAISAGPANESGQTLTFSTTNDNNALFLVQPAISAGGSLTFTPAADAFGTALVTVSLSDNGGTANGGVDNSSKTFTIRVSPVNDAPTNLILTAPTTPILESGSASLNGSFEDVETTDSHTVVIEWGDGGPTTTLNLTAGVVQFMATHTYADDNPTGTPSDVNAIKVTVTDNGQSGAPPVNDFKNVIATKGITVNNVAPIKTGQSFTFNPYTGDAIASVSFSDPGLLDTVTAAWTGIAGTPTSFTLGSASTLAGTSGGNRKFIGCIGEAIGVTISDDDTGSFNVPFAAANTLGVYTASFMAPIKDGARNIVKVGNVIPVKVQVLDCHGSPVLNRTLTVWLFSGILDADDVSDGDLTLATSVSAADTGNQMRVADGFYIFNLATKGLKNADFTIVIRDTVTGSLNIATAVIELKK